MSKVKPSQRQRHREPGIVHRAVRLTLSRRQRQLVDRLMARAERRAA